MSQTSFRLRDWENPDNPLYLKELEWQARRESNPDLWYRKPLFYPLNYRPCNGRETREVGDEVKALFCFAWDFEVLESDADAS